jgi:phage shock protein C
MNTTTTDPQSEVSASQPTRTLTRSRDRMLAGVASGIAAYVGVDAVVIRIAFVVLTLVGGLGIPLYLASWVLVPDERTRQSIVSEFTGDVRAWRD